jgi:hypothetical protein
MGPAARGRRARGSPGFRGYPDRPERERPTPVSVLRVDRQHRAGGDRRRHGGIDGLRRDCHHARGPDGNGNLLGSLHAALVSRPHAQGPPRPAHRHTGLRVVADASCGEQLRPGHRRDGGGRARGRRPAGLPHVPRSVSAPAGPVAVAALVHRYFVRSFESDIKRAQNPEIFAGVLEAGGDAVRE